MNLETGFPIIINQVTEAQLRDIIGNTSACSDFIILSASEETYIQAICDDDGFYQLEYRAGGGREHFICESKLTSSELLKIFISYFNGNWNGVNQVSWKSGA